jgi:ribose 5-phosphate isomerase B
VIIAFANDHNATAVRPEILEHLRKTTHEILDLGTDSTESVDYPEMAKKAVHAVQSKQADIAILICGAGIGMCIAANKFRGIRCALCTDEYGARMARSHNDANVLALRGRRMDVEQNLAIIDTFLNGKYEGGRHQKRLDLIARFEKEPDDAQP